MSDYRYVQIERRGVYPDGFDFDPSRRFADRPSQFDQFSWFQDAREKSEVLAVLDQAIAATAPLPALDLVLREELVSV